MPLRFVVSSQPGSISRLAEPRPVFRPMGRVTFHKTSFCSSASHRLHEFSCLEIYGLVDVYEHMQFHYLLLIPVTSS